jgi:hypothetical protein
VVINIGGHTSVEQRHLAIDDYLRRRLLGGHHGDSYGHQQSREAEENERRCELSHECPDLGLEGSLTLA